MTNDLHTNALGPTFMVISEVHSFATRNPSLQNKDRTGSNV